LEDVITEHQPGSPTAVISDRRTLKMFTAAAAPSDTPTASEHGRQIDPNLAAVLSGLQTLERIAIPLGNAAMTAAEKVSEAPAVKGGSVKWVLVVALLASAIFSLIFGVGGAAIAIWWHDTTTRGTVGSRLDDQDKAINGLIDATNGVVDEGEDGDAWLCVALAEGFGKPITCRSAREWEKIRRKMPSKIEPQ
jgi:hypothetical protein